MVHVDAQLLNVGFDEILLLQMFRDYLSVPIRFDQSTSSFSLPI